MKFKRFILLLTAVIMAISVLPMSVFADDGAKISAKSNLRRPVSPEQPMWIVHIDTWNYADPAKIIDLIPEDILPYVVFNISMSINYDHETHTWGLVNDGYELAKSWLRTCAEKNVWAMVQPASGGQCHFKDYPKGGLEGTLFEEFFRDYPNFLGFNYCEQFWGFESADFPVTPLQRYKHFANLLELTNKYGGYLVVSWCGNEWSQNISPLSMLRRLPQFEEACRKYTENFILCEKHTQTGYVQDTESLCLGAYLSGYSGQYGIRYDSTGWTNERGEEAKDFTLATGLSTHIEKLMQAGLTVIDGPELIWDQDFMEKWGGTRTSDGYTSRQWEMYDQFQNVMIDMFRKVIDGSIRIPSREEVIKNTKVVVIQDYKLSADVSKDTKFCSPESLFEGLYQMPGDGALKNNHNFFKSTGRYPAIPVVCGLADDVAKSFELKVNASDYSKKWRTTKMKTDELNKLFPKEYTGNIYARRNENSWTIYNPFKTDKSATGSIGFKYNTAEKLELSLSRYSAGVINEYPDKVNIYINNYDNRLNEPTVLKKDIFKFYGAAEEPKVSCKDRGVNQTKSNVTKSWKDGVLTISVSHNGPIDITVDISGNAENRLTKYTKSNVSAPARPPLYYGDRQYEAEHFEYKNVSKVVTNGCRTGVDNFTGQGYMIFGKNSNAAVKDTISVLEAGEYILSLRYALKGSAANNLSLYINGESVSSPSLKNTGSTSKWGTYRVKVKLKKGKNTFELKAKSSASYDIYLDNIVISKAK